MGLTSPVPRASQPQNHPPDFGTTRVEIHPPTIDPILRLVPVDTCRGFGTVYWPKHIPRPNFESQARRPLSYTSEVPDHILHPYRWLILLRLVALGFFLTWRVRHPNHEAMCLWGMSITCELWFAFSWLLDQLPKLCPVNRLTFAVALKERFQTPEGKLHIPGVDVFVSTVDPVKEPPLVTANTVLSILAVDYPVEKVACYLSDDGGSLLTFEALAETARFARAWVPFCRKHQIEPRNPESYFRQKHDFLKAKVRLDFMKERKAVQRGYDEFKLRINSLPESIRIRSNANNAHEELQAKKKQMEAGSGVSEPIKVPKATWMSDGSHWPGTWASAEPEHSKGDHAGIIKAVLAPPNVEPEFGKDADGENLIDSTDVDIRLPMLVYVSREKRPGYDHNKKAGAMNALVRTSAIMSNGPFILNLDFDHHIYNSLAIGEGICFMLGKGGDRICYVQFPQRFDGIDPIEQYANHNPVFFEVGMRAFDGLQGPIYVGTDCIFRRSALYGFSPPKPTKHLSKKEDEVVVLIDPHDDDADIKYRFGNSTSLAASIPVAEYQGSYLQDWERNGSHVWPRPACSLAVARKPVARKPLDDATVSEAMHVISCFYEDKTEWGKGVGWIYGFVTGDVVTGYKMHDRGWSSVYCVTNAFRATTPINLSDALHQVLRWATGSVEIFFSKNNALLAGPRMKFLQKVAYFNLGMYPLTSMFLIIYCFLPSISLFSGQFIVQSLNTAFLVSLLGITITQYWIALFEIKWSGITLHGWWRNKQFWLIGGTSAHPAAVLQGLLKVIAGVDISKSATPEVGDDEFADLYKAKWSFLMIPPITIILVHMIAIAIGVYRTLHSPFPQWSTLVGGVFFSFSVLCHLYPFAKGLLGRKG